MSSATGNDEHSTIIAQAAAHHARLASDEVTAADRRELERWLGQSAEHREVFESMQGFSGSLDMLGSDASLEALRNVAPELSSLLEESAPEILSADQAFQHRWRRPRYLAAAAAIALAVLIPILFFPASQPAPEPVVYQTATAERLEVTLDDGSSMALDAESLVSVSLFADERRVALRKGELFIEVALDADRPLTVEVGSHAVTALGTAFNIVYRDQPALVTVHDGIVEVTSAEEDAHPSGAIDGPMRVERGQQLMLEPGARPVLLDSEALLASAAWRDGWRHFDDLSLAEVVETLDRYVDRSIVITNRRVAELRLGGSFNVDQLDSVFASLEALLPIRITAGADRIIIEHVEDVTPESTGGG